MIISRTPYRISLAGGGTDYPSWSRQHGGLVVGGAINRFAYLTVRHLPPFHGFHTRLAYNEIERVSFHHEIRHRPVRAVLDYLQMGQGLEISHLGDLPGYSGVGSSSSFVVGLLNALQALEGRFVPPWELAEQAIHVEQQLLGETVGCQDQTLAAHGGLNTVKFHSSGEMDVFPLALSPQRLRELEQHLLLFFTGKTRTSSQVAGCYVPSLHERPRSQWALYRLAEQAVEAVRDGHWQKLGRIIDQSWRIKADLPGVANEDIDNLYLTARLAGAWGGKITGAGGGGCLLLVAPPEKQAAIAAALPRSLVHIPFRFEFNGSSILYAQHENSSYAA